jgi:hypothetical protein
MENPQEYYRSCGPMTAIEPDRFGLSHVPGVRGMWFIAGNLLRDLASLNRIEMLTWDIRGLMPGEHDQLSGHDEELLDRVAALTLAGDSAFSEARAICQDDRLRVPASVFNGLRNASETIEASLS